MSAHIVSNPDDFFFRTQVTEIQSEIPYFELMKQQYIKYFGMQNRELSTSGEISTKSTNQL